MEALREILGWGSPIGLGFILISLGIFFKLGVMPFIEIDEKNKSDSDSTD